MRVCWAAQVGFGAGNDCDTHVTVVLYVINVTYCILCLMSPVQRRDLLKFAAATPALLGFSGASAALRAAPASAAHSTAFFDDFIGRAGTAPNPAYWTAWNDWSSGGIAPCTPTNVYLDGNSHLVLQVTKSRSGYQGAVVSGSGALGMNPMRLSWGYGTIAASIRYPEGFNGSWPCFWALGVDYPSVSWPACGEIDVAEFFSSSAGYYSTMHGPGGNVSDAYNQAQIYVPATIVGATDLAAAFHTYWITRTASQLTVGVDSTALVTWTSASLASVGATWALAQNVFPIFDFLLYAVPPSGRLPATMLVDWIQYTPA